jgi:hypothetical protein
MSGFDLHVLQAFKNKLIASEIGVFRTYFFTILKIIFNLNNVGNSVENIL